MLLRSIPVTFICPAPFWFWWLLLYFQFKAALNSDFVRIKRDRLFQYYSVQRISTFRSQVQVAFSLLLIKMDQEEVQRENRRENGESCWGSMIML